ncbi:MAG: TlpA family protein disulfide reductase [Nevskiaceae bacterium]|jgi:thiol-disulfide isomerase/thioredoxin|nr:TlpA family protein disulfide reductase [Nevskiaceae bacterium]
MNSRIKALAIAATLLAAMLPAIGAAVEKGDVAPRFYARDFDGRAVEFPAVAAGKPAVVVFWATWCPYCKAFMPYLKNIQADYAAQGVKIVAIDAKEDGQGDPRAYVNSLGFKPIAIVNGDKIAEDYGIQYIPGVLIVDGKGTVAWRRPWTDLPAGRQVAELWNEQVRAALDDLLKIKR